MGVCGEPNFAKFKEIRMKRFLGVLAVCGLAFFGCASMMTTNERWAMSALYSIKTTNMNDIRGNLEMEELLIWKHVRTNDNRIILLSRGTQNTETAYNLVIDYLGRDWLYIDTLMLRIDDGGIITLKDASPSRSVDSRAFAREVVNFQIDSEILNLLRNCNSITLQFAGDPIVIPPEGITAIREFLN